MNELTGNQRLQDGQDYLQAGGDDDTLSLSLEKYVDILRNNKLAIAGVLALCLALGLAAALLATPQFRSTARVEIGLAEQNVTNVEGLQDDAVFADRAYLPTQYELLESRSLALRVVRELDLRQDEEFLSAFGVAASARADEEDAIVGILLRNVEIAPVTGSFLVDISFSSPSPQVSAKIANAWAQGYIEEDLSRRFGATIEARDFLEERLEQTRLRLEEAERELITYATDQELITINQGSDDSDSQGTASQTLVATELAALNRELIAATAERIAAESALASRSGATAGLEPGQSSSVTSALRARRAELQVELAELTSRFEDDYPPVQALRAQLQQLETAIEAEQAGSLNLLRANLAEARSREGRLQTQVDRLEGELIAQRRDSVEYNILQREVDTNRELYAGLLQRFREIGVIGVGESNILIVDQAIEPKAPYSPSIIKNLAIAFVVGLLLVAAGVYLYDLLNQSLRNPNQVKQRLGLELLASIPTTPEASIVDDLSQSYTAIYESYFSLTAALANVNGGAVPRSTMITSSRAGEGKSLSSAALAYLLSRQKKRVLLIDCDLRNSGSGKYTGLELTHGTTQYLQGDDDWRSMVRQSEKLEGFDIIPGGRKSLNVAELLANGRFQLLLDQVEPEYDHVVIDGPPVLGLVDAPLIAVSVEGVILVIEANEGKWRYIEGAIGRLKQANARILGAAVTKLDERNAAYGYGYGDGYGYGYGSDSSSSETDDPK